MFHRVFNIIKHDKYILNCDLLRLFLTIINFEKFVTRKISPEGYRKPCSQLFVT